MQTNIGTVYTAKVANGNGGNHNGNGGGDPPHTVTGRNLAHARRNANQKGAIAAQMVKGEVVLTKPTMIQAAHDAGANMPYVQLALKLSPESRARVAAGEITIAQALAANGLLEAWLEATPEVRAALGNAVGIDVIWDQVISPALD